ncbi:MAG: hypothetical protein AABW67_05560 [Nanoarchaeota archaeon]
MSIRPLFITIISILSLFLAILEFWIAYMVISSGSIVSMSFQFIPFSESLGGISYIISGLILIAFGIGLWKGKNWARFGLIIFLVLQLLFLLVVGVFAAGIYVLIEFLPRVLVYGLIIWYLGFSQNVKEFFNQD